MRIRDWSSDVCSSDLRHLAFATRQIETDIAELKSQGVEVEALRTDDYTGEKMVFFYDPDGLPIELHE